MPTAPGKALVNIRDVLPTAPYSELNAFCRRFATRAASAQTTYRFDT